MSDFGKIYAKRLFAPDRNETLTLMFVPIDLLMPLKVQSFTYEISVHMAQVLEARQLDAHPMLLLQEEAGVPGQQQLLE